MKGFATLTIIAAACTNLAAAGPVPAEQRQVYIPCSGLYGTAQCCATDVLGVADLDCGNRKFFRHVQTTNSTIEAIMLTVNLISPRSLDICRRVLGCLLRYWTACALLCPAHPGARCPLQHPHWCEGLIKPSRSLFPETCYRSEVRRAPRKRIGPHKHIISHNLQVSIYVTV